MKHLLFLAIVLSGQCSAIAGYNAIYFAPRNNIVGASYGEETKDKALRKARNQCKSRLGKGCKNVMWSNRCSSLYVSPGSKKYGYGAGWGDSRTEANKKAYRECKKSNLYCIRRVAACEDAYEDN